MRLAVFSTAGPRPVRPVTLCSGFEYTAHEKFACGERHAIASSTNKHTSESRACDPLDDAATLVRHIVQYNKLPDVQYIVHGFPPEVAREVEIPQHGPKIAFELSSRAPAAPCTMATVDYPPNASGWDSNLSAEEIPLNRHRFGRPGIVQ